MCFYSTPSRTYSLTPLIPNSDREDSVAVTALILFSPKTERAQTWLFPSGVRPPGKEIALKDSATQHILFN